MVLVMVAGSLENEVNTIDGGPCFRIRAGYLPRCLSVVYVPGEGHEPPKFCQAEEI
jgi:hypothetical protein